MQTTKSQILVRLKRGGPQTVGALAEVLTLAPMTVRQHLTSLERDGLVLVAAERQRKGRPHFIYGLTEQGERSFPKRYDRMAAQLLREISSLEPCELAAVAPADRVNYMLERLADRIVQQHALRLTGCSLEQRVREVAALLQEESGFVEWTAGVDGVEIRDYNCMYRSLTEASDSVCAWHRRLIEQLVGRPAASAVSAAADGCCHFVIAAEDLRPPSGRTGDRDTLVKRIPQEVH